MGKKGSRRGGGERKDEGVIKELERRVVEEAPPPGLLMQAPPEEAEKERQRGRRGGGAAGSLSFHDLAISPKTLEGLNRSGFRTLTRIQLAAIPHALAGRDVLAAAPTGSGKTLAFLIPILERLYRSRRVPGDGLAGLVVTPTRELALQIFEVLRGIGAKHNISAGLVTGGGKAFREEQARLPHINLLVATPGRFLQHLEQTAGVDALGLEVLVLDEADRLLDMGFNEQLNSILEYLPRERQTLLFSATQTRSVRDLARLSLSQRSVESVSVGVRGVGDENASGTGGGGGGLTLPEKLVQNYIVCGLEDKLNVLFSFVRTHLKSKIIVFLSSCAQVQFVNQLFCALRPGTPILALHGRCKHQRRTMVYLDFLRRPSSVLFATDVAARGLDFPAVDWVVQVDAPEDAEGYVHRVGRTARYKSGGRALLLLLPSEEKGVLNTLRKRNASLSPSKLTVNPKKMKYGESVTRRAAAEVAADPALRRRAEKALTSYVRSVRLMPDQETFNVASLDLSAYATSLGLPSVPAVAAETATKGKAGEEGRDVNRKSKNINKSLQRLKEQIKAEKQRKKEVSEGTGAPQKTVVEEEDGDDFLVPKRGTNQHELEDGSEDDPLPVVEAGRTSRKKNQKTRIADSGVSIAAVAAGSRKTVFNSSSDEESENDSASDAESESADLALSAARRVSQIKSTLEAADADDRARERERVREKHLKKRQRERGSTAFSEEREVTLGGFASAEESESSDGGDESGSDGSSAAENGGTTRREIFNASLQDQEDAVLQALKKRKVQ